MVKSLLGFHRFTFCLLGLLLLMGTLAGATYAEDKKEPAPKAVEPIPRIGYVDSPLLPGSPWRVHDLNRPRPRIVAVAADSGPVPPPSDAIVLFDGTDLSHWVKRGTSPSELFPAGWKAENGYLEVVPGAGDLQTIDTFGDCQLHIEWSAPTPPQGSSQGRGNSGIFLMGRYEIQILDSFSNVTYADGQAAAIYGQYPPLVNVTRPPGQWNVFELLFESPRFEGEKLVRPGFVTLLHNGVLVQYHRELLGAVAHKEVAKYVPHPPAGPISLQDHGNPTRFRNIWVRPLELSRNP